MILTPPGNSRYRHLESGIDLTRFDRMNNNGQVTRVLAEMRNDPVSVVHNVAPPIDARDPALDSKEPEVETFSDAEIREVLFDKKYPGALWHGVHPKDVESHLQTWTQAAETNRKEAGETRLWANSIQIALDALERQKDDLLKMVNSNAEFVAKRNRAARIREHIANNVRSVKAEYHRTHVECEKALAEGEALYARYRAKTEEVNKLCKDWGFGYPVEVYQKFDKLDEYLSWD